MNMHKNARLPADGAQSVARYQSKGPAGLADRSSRPHRAEQNPPMLVSSGRIPTVAEVRQWMVK